jgi:uroporphyrinogen decarboxylase
MKKKGRIVVPDERILQMFDIDTRPLMAGKTDYWNDIYSPNGTYIDEWKVKWESADGGHYINKEQSLKEGSIEELDRYDWPLVEDPGRIRGLKERAENLYKKTDYAIVFSLPSGIVHQCMYLRGFSPFLMDMVINEEYAAKLIEKVENIWRGIARYMLAEIGSNVDVVLFADDVGIQDSPMMSPDLYRRFVKPSHRRIINEIKEITEAIVLYHTCGSVEPLIEDFIEIGADVLNPIQVQAKGMEPQILKQKYGNRIGFWGGIDTQDLLCHGNTSEVRNTVDQMIKTLGKGGGYVVASVHNMQDDVKPENIKAMLETAVNRRMGLLQ